MARVFVAMSGGVDSSVAAALLLEQGHDVTGVTMQLWPEGDAEGGCCSVSAVRDAKRVCHLLGIAHYTLDFRESFKRAVVEPFREAYLAGRTPNPCIVCNDVVKFEDLLSRVKLQEAQFLATGHYARVEYDEHGLPWLAKAADAAKDQTYFLYRTTAEQLRHVLFPVGGLTKAEVRAYASRLALPTAAKAESQEICFVPRDDYRAFLAGEGSGANTPGPIVDEQGRVLGRHEGVVGFTVGQRKGLGLAGGPWYVTAVDAETNTVTVGSRDSLAVMRIECGDVRWRLDDGAARVQVRHRHRGQLYDAGARVKGGRLIVRLEVPAYGVAPGQAVVCYSGDRVVGGGVVEETA